MPRALSRLELQIVHYLNEHAAAAETSKGVNSAWLKRSEDAANIAEVDAALEELVAMDLLEKHVLPGGTTVYRRMQRGTD
jgi:hypothetical protein